MSGGSFNYLCYQEAEGLFERANDINDMFNALIDVGYAKDAAMATMDLKLELRRSMVHLTAMKDKLEPVWKAMEWWESGDLGEDGFKMALNKYRNKED